MTNLSGNSVSCVWRADGAIYKRSPKHLTDNEWYALSALQGTGFVPDADKMDEELIKMRYLVTEPITKPDLFRRNAKLFLQTMRIRKLRHGDLTMPHVFVVENSPVVIDWAESRMIDDPRPDKRREGDEHWMAETVENLIALQHARNQNMECHQ